MRSHEVASGSRNSELRDEWALSTGLSAGRSLPGGGDRRVIYFEPLRRPAGRPQVTRHGAIMARRDGQGTCEHCSSAFDYHLVHNGFNGSSYAYCESCGRTALLYREWPLAVS